MRRVDRTPVSTWESHISYFGLEKLVSFILLSLVSASSIVAPIGAFEL